MLPVINAKKEVDSIVKLIKETLDERKFEYAVLACSGGVDSSVALSLSVQALGKDRVFPLLLPYGSLNENGSKDANDLIQKMGISQDQTETVDITPAVNSFATMLGLNYTQAMSHHESIRLGNIMVRCRMIAVFDRAKKHHALVIGTENKSEHLLGYFTRFGDEASDIEPIRHLYKTQVYQLAVELGLPQAIVAKAPTAGLWPGQTDEGQFGFTYADADQILYALYDQKKPIAEVVGLGFSKDVVQKVSTWAKTNWFKHELPIGFSF